MDDHQDAELLNSIRTVIRLSRIAQQVCEEVGLTLAQYRALNSASRGWQRAYELAQYNAVSRPAISALTSGMVKSGFIEKTDSGPDGRGVKFAVTPAGYQALRDVEHLLAERFKTVLGDSSQALAILDSEIIESALDIQADKDFGLKPPPRKQKARPATPTR